MKTPTLIGLILIALAIMSLVIGGFSVTKREKVIDLGPLQASVDKKSTYPIPPIVGYVVLASGVILVGAGAFGKRV